MFKAGFCSTADVVCVIPPFQSNFGTGIPLGALTLGTLLKSVGISCRVLDLSLEVYQGRESLSRGVFDRCADKIISLKPKIIGFSCQCASTPMALAIISRLRSKTKSKIVMGGPQALSVAEFGKNASHFGSLFDEIFPAANERHFLEYCVQTLGISRVPTVSEFPQQPFPDYTLIPTSDLRHYPPVGYIDNARGCSGKCSFCSETQFWGRTVITKSAEATIEHIMHLHRNYGIIRFEFTHDNFLQPKTYVLDLLDRLKPLGKKITWNCRTRLETIKPEMLSRMKAAGCQSVLVGIETVSPQRIGLKNQRLPLEEIKTRVHAITDAGIIPTLSFIVGLPEEEFSEISDTLEFALECAQIRGVTSHIHKFSPLPFSSCAELSLTYLPQDVSDMAYSKPGDEDFNLEIQEIIKNQPMLCRGFYNVPHAYGGSLGSLAERINNVLYHFPKSFEVWRKDKTDNIIDQCLAFDPYHEGKTDLHNSILAYERARRECPIGNFRHLKLPLNFLRILNSEEVEFSDKMTDWLIIHRASGEKQLTTIDSPSPSSFSKLEKALKAEIKPMWEAHDDRSS
ncbi:radical SAM protein [Bdellovibrionota bacterium FG-1]